MPTFAELKVILKENQIRGYCHYNKSKLYDLLLKRGLIPENLNIDKVKAKRDIDFKYNFLRQIYSNPKKVGHGCTRHK